MKNGRGANGGKTLVPLPESQASAGRTDHGEPGRGRRLIFLSGTVYPVPLSPTVEKKMRRLAEYGAVTVVAWADGLMPRRLREPVRFVLLPRLPGIILRYPLFLLAGLLVIFLAVRRRASNILVAQSPYEGVVALLGRGLARIRGTRPALAVEVHGDWEEVPRLFRRLWFPWLSMRIMAWSACAVLRRADVVRVISRFTEEKVRQLCPNTPLVKFPTFTDLEVFLDAPAPPKTVADFPYILYVGMLVPSKGIEVLIRAFDRIRREHPDARLVLIGSGYAEDQFRSLVRASALDQAVLFIPPMSQAELATWMQASLCLVLPSFSEGLGRVVLEAMACGRPVVATQVGGIPELVLDQVTGILVPPGDVNQLADALLSVLKDPKAAEAMGGRGRDRAKTLFSEVEYFRAYEDMFRLAERIGDIQASGEKAVRP
jgi:glycosyltransferase involved in cell wall biosynthesis